MNLILCGMPGCGKSTVAAILAENLSYKLYDTDELIQSHYGDITEIFALHGENYFRVIEADVTEKVCSYAKNSVIAVGGGCVTVPQNVKNLKAAGKIIYLKASPETLLKRLENDEGRPLLAGDKKKKINEIYYQRAAVYESVADKIIETDGLTPESVAELIEESI